MGFVRIAALKDLRRLAADPLALLLWLGIPLLVGGLLSLLSGDAGVTPRAHLLVADQDGSFVTEFLTASSNWGGVIEVESVEFENGRTRLDAGEASGLLVIPEGFGAALLSSTPTRLTLITNPAQRILPGILQGVLEILAEAAYYVQQLLAEPLQRLKALIDAGRWPTPAETAEVMASASAALEGLRDTAFPPVLQLKTLVEPSAPATTGGFGLIFLPGVLFMSLMFVAQGLSDDVWKERDAGTLRRFAATPRGLGQLLAGKLLASLLVVLAVSAVGLVVGSVGFGLAPARIPAAIAWCVLTGSALYCYFAFLQLLATSARGAGLLTNAIVFPLIMIGGSFFPFEAMPVWMAEIGRCTPNGQAVVQLKRILRAEAETWELIQALALIVGSAGAAFALAARRLRARMAA